MTREIFPDNIDVLFIETYPNIPIKNLQRIYDYSKSNIYLYYFNTQTGQIYFYNVHKNWDVVPSLVFTQIKSCASKLKKYNTSQFHRVLSIINPRDLPK